MRAWRIALAIAVLTPGTAFGATVDLQTVGGGKDAATVTLTYTAAAGEANRVTITQGDGNKFTVTDAGAPLTPSGDCQKTGDSVTCSAGFGNNHINITLGDGDDTATITAGLPWQANVDGGAGNDTIGLTADSTAPSFLTGGEGTDTLTGGAGTDTLDGGAGADTLDGAGGDADVAFYGNETTPVIVDLSQPKPPGAGGDQDGLTNIEGVTGGSGDDTLTGDAGNNRLDGGDGSDTLAGGDGDDEISTGDGAADQADGGAGNDKLSSGGGPARLIGGLGNDVLNGGDHGAFLLGGEGNDELGVPKGVGRAEGGPGDDVFQLFAAPHSTKGVFCGPGIDTIAALIGKPAPRGCERLRIGPTGEQKDVAATVSLRSGRLHVSAPFLCGELRKKCSLQVTVRAGGHSVGVGKTTVRAGDDPARVLRVAVSGVRRGGLVTLVYTTPPFTEGGPHRAIVRVQ